MKQPTIGHHNRLQRCLLVFKPDPLLKWQRKLIKRKWAFGRRKRTGRPRIDLELEAPIVRIVQENARWGYKRVHGELIELGFKLDSKTVRNVLKRKCIPPAPQRRRSTWRTFSRNSKEQYMACDFFTVQTIFLKRRLYTLFFIEYRVYFAGTTANLKYFWTAQQTIWKLDEEQPTFHYLIHDQDTKFNRSFDNVFRSVGMDIVRTPFRAHRLTRSLSAGYGQFDRNAWITSSF